MTTNGRVRDEEPNVATSFSELTHDVIELAELQARLLALDIKSTTQKTRRSLVLSVVGVCLLLGSVPVALFALAELLIEQLSWSHTAGFAVATLVGIGLSGGILAAAYFRFTTGLDTMQRSRDELSRNIAWVKSSLRSQRQPQAAEKD